MRVFHRKPRHHQLIPLPGVPLLEDDAGLPYRRARLNGHQSPNELRMRLCLDLQKVELVLLPGEPPHGDVIGACGNLR